MTLGSCDGKLSTVITFSKWSFFSVVPEEQSYIPGSRCLHLKGFSKLVLIHLYLLILYEKHLEPP